MKNLYEKAGVSLEKGYESVELIKEQVKKTDVKGVLSQIGSFNALFDLSAVDVQNPVLVSGCDGVGTKILIAEAMQNFDHIGQDLVAMCVNDILVQGAQPLFFLDYIACGENKPEVVNEIVGSIARGCQLSGCALVGGETAEMPDCYEVGTHDLAGFVVGVVDKLKIIDGTTVKPQDVLIGIKSNGVHSNGFSLVRKLLNDNNINLSDKFLDGTVGDELIKPTRIYKPEVDMLMQVAEIKAMAHITGGGLIENIPRSLNGRGAMIDLGDYKVPEIFKFLQELASISNDEMYNYFNMGIGFVVIVDPSAVTSVLANCEDAFVIGQVCEEPGVHFENSCRS